MARRTARFAPPDLPPAGGVITSITRSPAAPDVFLIKIGKRAAGRIHESTAASLRIAEDAPWTDRLREAIASAMLEESAREWAIHAVARRAMSRAMLINKLRQRFLPPALAARIAEDLVARGILNEKSFAEGLVETTISRKAAGKRLLVTRLRSKGIHQRLATDSVEKVTTESGYDAREAALDLARRKLRSMGRLNPEQRQRRLYGLLARRGFDSDLCREIVDRLVRHPED